NTRNFLKQHLRKGNVFLSLQALRSRSVSKSCNPSLGEIALLYPTREPVVYGRKPSSLAHWVSYPTGRLRPTQSPNHRCVSPENQN
ncbi:MAG: hypothetical protein ACYTXY_23955, partial [Nostoc sp.]